VPLAIVLLLLKTLALLSEADAVLLWLVLEDTNEAPLVAVLLVNGDVNDDVNVDVKYDVVPLLDDVIELLLLSAEDV
jgi:coenzyme F420-reducing hydrogenase gamma subunit